MAVKKQVGAAKPHNAAEAELAFEAKAALSRKDEEQDTSKQIAELRALAASLAEAFQVSQSRASQEMEFREALGEIKQVARNMAAPAVPTRVAVGYEAAPYQDGRAAHRCDPCGCTSSECCTFDIVLHKVRATRPQIEPADMGDIPLAQNALEIRIYMTAGGQGVLIPSLASTLDLRADGLPPGPGPWVILDRLINRVQIKKGITQSVNLYAEVEEDDSRLTEQASLAGKNEVGEAFGTIALNCCMEEIYPPAPLDVDLRFGGEGRGAVQLMVMARRVCS